MHVVHKWNRDLDFLASGTWKCPLASVLEGMSQVFVCSISQSLLQQADFSQELTGMCQFDTYIGRLLYFKLFLIVLWYLNIISALFYTIDTFWKDEQSIYITNQNLRDEFDAIFSQENASSCACVMT